ncbi:MAG: GNAT family N-acetyltransferase [Pirellulaceae bacterium]|nr:GNAT family N-acetyltransferase [Pirellulaceae bacterium]
MGSYHTRVIRSLAEFQACQASWTDLYNRCPQHRATAQHELIVAYWQAFLPSEAVQVHVLVDRATEQWVAALPTYQHRLWRMLPTAHNFSSPWCLGLTGLVSPDHDATTTVNELLTSISRTGAMMLTFDLVSHDDPLVQALSRTADSGSRVANFVDQFQVGKTVLEPTWEAFTKDWSKKRRRFIRRAGEQLGEVGSWQMKTLHSADWSEVESAWAKCLEVESLGWKGQNGSDLAANSGAKSYYEKLLQHLYQTGELRFYTLELDGRVIAYDLGYLKQRVATSLKVSYHPEYTSYSPGHVLNSLVIQDLIQKQEADWIDTVGELNAANMKWCRESYLCQRVEVSLDNWFSRTTVRSREWLRVIKRRLNEKPTTVAAEAAAENDG